MKGFIGPLGDDIPSIIAILLALSLFFSGITFALNAFSEKSNTISVLKASIEMSRAATSKVILPENIRNNGDPLAVDINNKIKYVAQSYGVEFNEFRDIFYENNGVPQAGASCKIGDYIIKHLVPTKQPNLSSIELRTLVICVRKGI